MAGLMSCAREKARTLSDSCWGNEGSLGHRASCDAGEGGALWVSVKIVSELRLQHTEALRVCANMLKVMVVSNWGLNDQLGCSRIRIRDWRSVATRDQKPRRR